ncbi:hypothetical protein GBAR_LOCUS18830 [Geodia barretti]|uniref:Uncharacterized protein n=1 Tax=Geodia barretti TaxID=519541 RepID=A0AA35WUK8_GEOBA|nr:hypothetical protein GBAR_LOCUS18830 [Geodia barretti]
MLSLNELPPNVHCCRAHMFLAGIWCSSKKPPTAHCLKAVVEELEFLATEGIRVNIRGQGSVICKPQLLLALVDLPAKAALYNVMAVLGAHAVVAVGRGRTRVYVYKRENSNAEWSRTLGTCS